MALELLTLEMLHWCCWNLVLAPKFASAHFFQCDGFMYRNSLWVELALQLSARLEIRD